MENCTGSVAGNPDLCTSGKSCDDATTTTTTNTNTDTFDFPTRKSSSSTGKKKNKKVPVILGTTIPLALFGSAFVSLLAWLRHKKKKLSKASKHHAGSGKFLISLVSHDQILAGALTHHVLTHTSLHLGSNSENFLYAESISIYTSYLFNRFCIIHKKFL